MICTCFGVTENEIEKMVKENDLKTIEDVTNYCKAGGGCQGCHSNIKEIIDKLQVTSETDDFALLDKLADGILAKHEKIGIVN